MLPARPAADDQIVRRLLLARLVSLGGLSPRRLGMVALGLALAAAVRMVKRVHRDSPHMAAIVASAGALDRDQQAFLGLFFGELGEIRNLHEALAGSARI